MPVQNAEAIVFLWLQLGKRVFRLQFCGENINKSLDAVKGISMMKQKMKIQ